jgi:hypothetical protein
MTVLRWLGNQFIKLILIPHWWWMVHSAWRELLPSGAKPANALATSRGL